MYKIKFIKGPLQKQIKFPDVNHIFFLHMISHDPYTKQTKPQMRKKENIFQKEKRTVNYAK